MDNTGTAPSSVDVSGLQPGTKYVYRICGSLEVRRSLAMTPTWYGGAGDRFILIVAITGTTALRLVDIGATRFV